METEKQRLRKEMSGRRNRLTAEEICRKSGQIFDRLTTLDIYRDAEIIYSYGSFRSEVRTWEFHRRVLADHKILALPKVISRTAMEFYHIRHPDELVRGYMGIMEPGEKCPVISPSDIKNERCLMLLPGLAFDREFSRLGYGGGYYDRYLAEKQSTARHCGIAFDFQLLNRIPKEPLDHPVDMILTESCLLERMDGR